MTVDDTISFTVNVKNTGTREGRGSCSAFYISDKKSSLPRPVKELKGFQKVKLAPGEEKAVTLTIDKKALSFFDDAKHEWVLNRVSLRQSSVVHPEILKVLYHLS